VVLRRANVGAGSIQPEGWDNFDIHWFEEYDNPPGWQWDVRQKLYEHVYDVGPTEMPRHTEVGNVYDYAVCSFMLQELNHHEIPGAMENMMAILKPGGTLRVLVPNVMRAFHYYNADAEDWFPQDDRTGDLAAKFCCYITWYGTVRSVFNIPYLRAMLEPHGHVWQATFGETATRFPEITELDSRLNEAMIMEVTKL
jgi:predicted SAM-dependent methyltransferase